jgi:uncharacterized membrane protein (DUF373 family)
MSVQFRRQGSAQIRHVAGRRREAGQSHRTLGAVAAAEDCMHYAVALVLVAVAGIVLIVSVRDFFDPHDHTFPERITGVINSVLFVIIVMEILRTVVAHFDDAGLQLKPFLIIGIISAVRHILTVGAQVSLGAGGSATHFSRTQLELGVNAAVVLALVVGLVLVWRGETEDDPSVIRAIRPDASRRGDPPSASG